MVGGPVFTIKLNNNKTFFFVYILFFFSLCIKKSHQLKTPLTDNFFLIEFFKSLIDSRYQHFCPIYFSFQSEKYIGIPKKFQ